MNVLFLSPGFPAEMPLFVRGLAQVGAKVFGVGDQPAQALPKEARHGLADYLQVQSLGDETATIQSVRNWLRGRSIDRVESLWETQMFLAARMRNKLAEDVKARELSREAESIRDELLSVLKTLTPSRDEDEERERLREEGARGHHHRAVEGRARAHRVRRR